MSDLPERQWLMREPAASESYMRLVRDEETSPVPDVGAADALDAAEHDAAADLADDADVCADDDATAIFASTAGMRIDRRDSRRFDVESWDVSLDRWDGRAGGQGRSDGGRPEAAVPFGKVLDLSAGGVRVRTRQANLHADQQIRVRLALPDAGGISPFVDLTGGRARPTREWTGWLDVRRVRQVGDAFEVAGRLVDMEAMDRDMLRLYLSAQPMAA